MLLFVPHVLMVFGLLFFIIAEPIFLLATPPTQAKITRLYSHLSNGKGKPTRSMDYTYLLGSRIVTDTGTLSPGRYAALHPGAAIRVYVMRIGSWHYSEPDRSAMEYLQVRWPLWLFGIGGPALIIYLVRMLLRPRRLVRDGQPTMGRITLKRSSRSGKSNTWALTYEYHSATGELLTGFMNVSREDFEQAAEQQDVVVLYDPVHPGQSLIYDYCAYKAM